MPGVISAGAIFLPQGLFDFVDAGTESVDALSAAEGLGDVADTLSPTLATAGDVSAETIQAAGEAQQFVNIFGSSGELNSIFETPGEAISGAALSEEAGAAFTSIGEKIAGDSGAAANLEEIASGTPISLEPTPLVVTPEPTVVPGDITLDLEAEKIPGAIDTPVETPQITVEPNPTLPKEFEIPENVPTEVPIPEAPGSSFLGDISSALVKVVKENPIPTVAVAAATLTSLYLAGVVTSKPATTGCSTGQVTGDPCCGKVGADLTDCQNNQGTYVKPTTVTESPVCTQLGAAIGKTFDVGACNTCMADKTVGLSAATLLTDKSAYQLLGICMGAHPTIPSPTGTASPTGTEGTKDVCDLNGLTGTDLSTCKSCLSTLNLAGKTTLSSTEQTSLQACRIKGPTPSPTPGGTGTASPTGTGATKDVCDLSGLSGTQLASCKSCLNTLNLAGIVTITADQKTAINACMGTTPAGGTKDVCDISGLVDTQLANCKSCLNTLNLAGKTSVTAEQITNIQTCMKSGTTTTAAATTTATEAAAMAAAKAVGKDPCSAAGLRVTVQAACKQCYQAGMTDAQLVTCVNGKLATGVSPVAVVTATLQKYAIPIVLGVAIVGGVAYATHGTYWGKKGKSTKPR